MFIKDKEITSNQLLLIKQDRVLVNWSTCFFDKWIWIFFFYFLKKWVGQETKHFIGMAFLKTYLKFWIRIKNHLCKMSNSSCIHYCLGQLKQKEKMLNLSKLWI